MVLTNQADAMIFAAMKRGDYLPFAERNMREEFPIPQKPLAWVCGWCPDAREKTEALIAAGKRVTTGICPACEEKMR